MATHNGKDLYTTARPTTALVQRMRFVTPDSGANAGKYKLAVVLTAAKGIGVTMESYDPATDTRPGVLIRLAGTADVECGATVAAGDLVKSDATGRAITDAAGYCVALTGGAVGEFIEVTVGF